MAWKNAPTNFSVEFIKDADNLTKRITGEILQKVVVASPVDTGAFRGNWRTSSASVDGTVDLESLDRSGQGSIARGLAVIQSRGGLGKLIYISNSLPYAVKLNNGYSMQAPLNFVELSMQSVLNKYR